MIPSPQSVLRGLLKPHSDHSDVNDSFTSGICCTVITHQHLPTHPTNRAFTISMEPKDYEAALVEANAMVLADWRKRWPFLEQQHMDVNFVLIRDIPKLKYHSEPLRFVSEPGISQKEYERRVLATT